MLPKVKQTRLMDIAKKGWIGAKLSSPGATVSGLPSKKGKGKKNPVKTMEGGMLLGGKLKNNTKNPGKL